MARTDGSWYLVAVSALVLMAQPQACQNSDSPSVIEDKDSVATYLDGVATEVIQPQLADMQTQVDELIIELNEFSQDTSQVDQLRDVQEIWIETVTQWQSAEVLQITALGSSWKADDGADLRDVIYS